MGHKLGHAGQASGVQLVIGMALQLFVKGEQPTASILELHPLIPPHGPIHPVW
jgi:hypothetical protein